MVASGDGLLGARAISTTVARKGLLGESVAHNGLGDRIAAFQNAVSSEPATLDFVDNPENAGDSFIETEDTMEKSGNRYEVEAVALDEFAPLQEALRRDGGKIGAIKMDIQGAEAAALKGMRQLVEGHRPMLAVEMDDLHLRHFGSSAERLRREIIGIGYRLERTIEGNEIYVPISMGSDGTALAS